jgi:hypothetical protein
VKSYYNCESDEVLVEEDELRGTLFLQSTKAPQMTSAGHHGIIDKKGIELEIKDVVQLVASSSVPNPFIGSSSKQVTKLQPCANRIANFVRNSDSKHAKFAMDLLNPERSLLLVHSCIPLTKASVIGVEDVFCPTPGQEEVSVANSVYPLVDALLYGVPLVFINSQ